MCKHSWDIHIAYLPEPIVTLVLCGGEHSLGTTSPLKVLERHARRCSRLSEMRRQEIHKSLSFPLFPLVVHEEKALEYASIKLPVFCRPVQHREKDK